MDLDEWKGQVWSAANLAFQFPDRNSVDLDIESLGASLQALAVSIP